MNETYVTVLDSDGEGTEAFYPRTSNYINDKIGLIRMIDRYSTGVTSKDDPRIDNRLESRLVEYYIQ